MEENKVNIFKTNRIFARCFTYMLGSEMCESSTILWFASFLSMLCMVGTNRLSCYSSCRCILFFESQTEIYCILLSFNPWEKLEKCFPSIAAVYALVGDFQIIQPLFYLFFSWP